MVPCVFLGHRVEAPDRKEVQRYETTRANDDELDGTREGSSECTRDLAQLCAFSSKRHACMLVWKHACMLVDARHGVHERSSDLIPICGDGSHDLCERVQVM